MKFDTLIECGSKPNVFTQYTSLLSILGGSLFLALMAQVAIPLPFTPIPMSLQTFGVALLAIFLGPRQAAFAVIAYLLEASIGMPVLAGGLSNPLWMIGPKAGYLAAFVIAAYVTGTLVERKHFTPFSKMWLILSLNEAIILMIGTAWLAMFFGVQIALEIGFIPFLPGAAIKITMAASSLKLRKEMQIQ